MEKAKRVMHELVFMVGLIALGWAVGQVGRYLLSVGATLDVLRQMGIFDVQ
jgi:hypothetical protein